VTHNVVEAERGVERLAVLHRGRVVAQGTPAQLRERHGDRLRLELVATDEATASRLADEFAAGPVPSLAPDGPGLDAARTGRRVVVPIDATAATDALGWAQRERAQGRLDEFSVTPVSLEDVYIGLVGPTEEVDHGARAA
jgi:ABC-2 type transport system ATP-binding protein